MPDLTATNKPYELFVDDAGEDRWRIVGSNGEPMATSEGYTGGPAKAERGYRDLERRILAGLDNADLAAEVARRLARAG